MRQTIVIEVDIDDEDREDLLASVGDGEDSLQTRIQFLAEQGAKAELADWVRMGRRKRNVERLIAERHIEVGRPEVET